MNRLILPIILCFSTVIVLSGCAEDKTSVVEPEYVEVGLKLSLEGVPLDKQQVPAAHSLVKSISKSVSNDLYAVQIYTTALPNATYIKYGYGLYDDISLFKVKLIKDKYYNVVITCIKDGKTTIAQNASLGYEKPFDLFGTGLGGGTDVINEIKITPSGYFKSLSEGAALLRTDDVPYSYPLCDRYYGESGEFKCGDVTSFGVNLKHVVFGLDISAEKVTSGQVKLSFEGAPDVIVAAGDKAQFIYTMQGGKPVGQESAAWVGEDYSETVTLCLYHDNGSGFELVGSPQSQVFVRRYSYPIDLSLTLGGRIDVSLESSALLKADPIIF